MAGRGACSPNARCQSSSRCSARPWPRCSPGWPGGWCVGPRARRSRRAPPAARGLDRVEATARALRQDGDAATRHFALDPACAESQRATLALQRLVDAHRERVQALLASNLALGQRLSHRTHELSTLQDLSIGLATQSGLHELVDEALGALEQTV